MNNEYISSNQRSLFHLRAANERNKSLLFLLLFTTFIEIDSLK